MMGAPLGDSQAGAAVVAAAFFVLSLLSLNQFRTTRFRVYVMNGVAGTLRGIAYAIRAATIGNGFSSTGESVIFHFFTTSGFAMAIAAQMLCESGWLLNTAPRLKSPTWSMQRMASLFLFACLWVFGPVLGLTAALLTYANGSQSAIHTGSQVLKASYTAIFIIVSISFLTALQTSLLTLRRSGSLNLRKHANEWVLCLLPGTLLLAWPAAFRLAAVWEHPSITGNEDLFYPLQVLPELLQLATFAIPTLYARVHLSTRFEEWWRQMHPDGPEPTFGFPENSKATTAAPAGPEDGGSLPA